MERREKAAEPNVRHSQDVTEREEQRREDDTKAGAQRPDTEKREDPPEPFSGPHH